MAGKTGGREHDQVIAELERKGLVYQRPAQGGRAAQQVIRYAGLVDLATSHGLVSLVSEIVQFMDAGHARAIVRAVACFEQGGAIHTFSGIGSCLPVEGGRSAGDSWPYEMADTRARGRALRDGVNLGDLKFAEDTPTEAVDDDEHRTAPAPAPATAARGEERGAGLRRQLALTVAEGLRETLGEQIAVPPAVDDRYLATLVQRALGTIADDGDQSAEQRARLEAAHGAYRAQGVAIPHASGPLRNRSSAWYLSALRSSLEAWKGAQA